MNVDELNEWIAHMNEISPEFRRGWYRAQFRDPLPLKSGAEYRRRSRRR
jgi:hypothetical protein